MIKFQKTLKYLFPALLLTAILFSALLHVCAAEEDGFENDPLIKLTVSASSPTEEGGSLTGSGKLTSAAKENIFNFFASDESKKRSLSIEYEINGKTEAVKDRYFSYVCGKAGDYGEMTVRVYERGGELLAVFHVTLAFEKEGSWLSNAWKSFKRDFELNFIIGDRWKLLLQGLGNTLLITAGALAIGIVIGTVVAAVRSTYDKNAEMYALRGGFFAAFMRILNAVCKLYLTVIRGTPVVVQLLIMYFIVFAGGSKDLFVAVLAFGVNSGAYVAEILRGGIMSVDPGQFEAGRSLGFNYVQTMVYIIIPQMFKSSLPALCNEFISLLKETSVAGYVPIIELTKAGNIIRSSTYTAFLPLIAVALIYLVIVIILSKLVGLLERRLRKSER